MHGVHRRVYKEVDVPLSLVQGCGLGALTVSREAVGPRTTITATTRTSQHARINIDLPDHAAHGSSAALHVSLPPVHSHGFVLAWCHREVASRLRCTLGSCFTPPVLSCSKFAAAVQATLCLVNGVHHMVLTGRTAGRCRGDPCHPWHPGEVRSPAAAVLPGPWRQTRAICSNFLPCHAYRRS